MDDFDSQKPGANRGLAQETAEETMPKEEEFVPFGPPPKECELRRWNRQLAADMGELRKRNPPVDPKELLERLTI